MKIVLREDVPNVGDKGTVQVVKNGYARNFLIPKGFAVQATPGELKQVEEFQKVQSRKIAKEEAQLQALSDKINGQTLEFTARASADTGRLFGSVTSGDIAEKLNAKIGEDVDRRKIVLDEPIRSIGDHEVTIHLVGRLRPTVKVTVRAAAAEEDDAEAVSEEATAEVGGTDGAES